jgi:O-antigen/teichoic acid export membrane protein
MNIQYDRIFKTFSYGFLSFLSTFINRYLIFPLIIFYWGSNTFNEWILITNIALHFSLFDFGSKTYLGNKLAKNKKRIQYYYKYLALTNSISLICIISCLALVLNFFELADTIKTLPKLDYILVIVFSTFVVFINIIIGNYGDAILRPLGLYYKYQKIEIIFSLLISFILISSLFLLNAKILTFTIINFALISLKLFFLHNYIKNKNINLINFVFNINSLSKKKFKIISLNGFFFYLGNIVNLIQTSTLILIGSLGMGIDKIGSFVAHKTLSNLSAQLSNLLALSYTYEYTKSTIARENEKLIYHNIKISNYTSAILNIFLIIFSELIFDIWLQSQILFNKYLFSILIISTLVRNYSSTIANFLWSKNKQINFNSMCLILSLGTIPIAYLLSIKYGINGLGFTYLIYEILYLIIVFIFFGLNFRKIKMLKTFSFETIKIIIFSIAILYDYYYFFFFLFFLSLFYDLMKIKKQIIH